MKNLESDGPKPGERYFLMEETATIKQKAGIIQIVCGDAFTLALCRTGKVYAWG